jgi:hypothetical protein
MHIHLLITRCRILRMKRLNMSLPKEGSRNARGSDEYKSPSPLHPLCDKRQQASGIEDQDYVLEQLVYDH